jgi:hypothetical protein
MRPYSAPSVPLDDPFIAYRRQQSEQFCAQALASARIAIERTACA